MNDVALTYDDIQLVPSYSDIDSRTDIDLSTQFTSNFDLEIPIIASPMDTVCGVEMAQKLHDLGGVGCLHRFMNKKEQSEKIYDISRYVNVNKGGPKVASIGIKDDDVDRALQLIEMGANVLLIDVAHGDHKNVIKMIETLKRYDDLPPFDIIAGNVATADGAKRLEDAGADAIRVGIGGGSLCTTRIKTGFGVPNVTAIENVAKVVNIPIIADGGIRNSGDIVKALSVGADTVMLGSLLAGTEEAPGKIIEKDNHLYKRYRGSASLETKIEHGQEERNIEGESTIIAFKGGLKYIVNELTDGIRSGLSYAGCDNIKEFQAKSKYVRVTNAGISEANPHLL